ncbi:hypothetical protein ACKKBG_A00835 [Auxenochlorella protothecoides x Auxenochlorella symbiontica]
MPSCASYALECNEHWCKLILEGRKSMEVRSYPFPEPLAGQRVLLLATNGQAGRPALGDGISAGSTDAKAVGWVIFDGIQRFESASEFEGAYGEHCVPSDSPFAWAPRGPALYGWRIREYERAREPCPLPRMTRLLRSVYEINP